MGIHRNRWTYWKPISDFILKQSHVLKCVNQNNSMHISNNESDQKKIVKVFRVNKVLREKLVKIFKKGGKIGKKEKKKGRERQAKKRKNKATEKWRQRGSE